MFKLTRRALLRASIAGGGALVPSAVLASALAAFAEDTQRHVPSPHRFFEPAEFATLDALCSLIIPADEHSGGAHEAGAAEYIDLLAGNNSKFSLLFRGGLAWLNAISLQLHNGVFTELSTLEQAGLLEKIAYGKTVARQYRPGAIFFDWARRMTVDAYYTSRVGIADLGYMGNSAAAEFVVPPEVVEQAQERFDSLLKK